MGFSRTVAFMVLRIIVFLFILSPAIKAQSYQGFTMQDIAREKIRLTKLSESDDDATSEKADEELEKLESYERRQLSLKRQNTFQIGVGLIHFNGKFLVNDINKDETELLSNASASIISFSYSNENYHNYYLARASFFNGISILNGEGLTEAIQASNSGVLLKAGAGLFFEEKSSSLGLSIPFLYKKTEVTDTETRTVKALNEAAFGIGLDYSWRFTKKFSFDFSMSQIQGLQSVLWDTQIQYRF